jgi:LPS sulfotransferase NodH
MSFKRRLAIDMRRRALDLGLYGQSDYTPFVILGRSRVGSNLLRSLLNAHPNVMAFGEIFRDVRNPDWDHIGYFQSKAMRSLAVDNPVHFIEAKVLGRYPGFVRAAGFKLFYYHAREGAAASVWPYLQGRRDIKVLHLKRRNLLQTHVSRKRAALTGRWVNTSAGQDRSEVITVDYQECLDDFVQTRKWEEDCDAYFAGHPLLQMQYERLAADYPREAGEIQAFLGIEARAVTPSTYQQASAPLSSVIANYGELKERFDGTVWREFFTD